MTCVDMRIRLQYDRPDINRRMTYMGSDVTQDQLDSQPPVWEETKKPPRKPRPSELAKKAAKAKKVKPKTKRAKPKAKKKVAEVSRPCRQELRLTRPEKAKLVAKAKKTRRTITSIFAELIEKMR